MHLLLLFFSFYFAVISNAVASVISVDRRLLQIVILLLVIVFLSFEIKNKSKHLVTKAFKLFFTAFVVSFFIASPSFLNLFHYAPVTSSVTDYLCACVFIALLITAFGLDVKWKDRIKSKHMIWIFLTGCLVALIAYFTGPNNELDAHIDFKGSSILLGSFSVVTIYIIHFYYFFKGWKYVAISLLLSLPFYYILFLSTSRGAIFIYLALLMLFLIRSIYFSIARRSILFFIQFLLIQTLFLTVFSSVFIKSNYYPYYAYSNPNPEVSVELRNLEFMLRYSRFLRLVNDYISADTRDRIRKYIEDRTAFREGYVGLGNDRLNAGLGTNLSAGDERFAMYKEVFKYGVPWNGYWPKPYKQYTKVDCGGGVGLCEYPHNIFLEGYYNFGILFFILIGFVVLFINLQAAYYVVFSTDLMAQSVSIAVIVISLLSMYTSKISDYLVYAPVFILFACYKRHSFSFLAMITNLKQNLWNINRVKSNLSR